MSKTIHKIHTNVASATLHTLTEAQLLREFQRVGRGLPSTTLHSASTERSLYLTSTVGNFKPTLHKRSRITKVRKEGRIKEATINSFLDLQLNE